MRTQDISLIRARRFRKTLTGAELGLWVGLKNRQLGGFKFRRQHPIGPYILDFYCPEAPLAVEIDGYSHGVAGAMAHDARRDAWLRDRGVETYRIGADDMKEADAAAAALFEVLRRNAPSVTP
jgi:very-short-patch-repair endonuclease